MWKKLLSLWKSDNLLEQAWRETYEMLRIDEEMLLAAMHSLRESDEADPALRELDQQVNEYERDVRRKVMTHCSLQGPASLPAGMVLICIIIDIERIGDYAKNIVDLAMNHPARLQGGRFEPELQRIETAVKELFSRTRTALQSSDPEVARALLRDYKWVGKACEAGLMGLVHEEDPNLRPGDAVSLGIYFRWLKRINSHLRNILTSAVNPFDRIGFKPEEGNP